VDAPRDVTSLLTAWRGGDVEAGDRLFSVVYDDLRRIAHRQLARERADHTLGATALVHEAYVRLVDQTRAEWVDRGHFFAVASRVMRRILMDYARRSCAEKRGGGAKAIMLDEAEQADDPFGVDDRAETLLAVDEALVRLFAHDERLGRVVECRFFGGLTDDETGETLGVARRTVQRDWVRAKNWLYEELRL
jgi:RNA polymerase sigma factor (TIGR02999 family)